MPAPLIGSPHAHFCPIRPSRPRPRLRRSWQLVRQARRRKGLDRVSDIDQHAHFVDLMAALTQMKWGKIVNTDSSSEFLQAWKHAVQLSGWVFFGDGTEIGLMAAADKNQLRPRWDVIEAGFHRLNRSEQFLLAHTLTFFNPDTGGWPNQKYVSQLSSPTIGEASAVMDFEGRAVLARLLISYEGW